MAVTDFMKRGMDWFADKMQANLGREVTYRGIRNGSEIVLPLTVGVGASQLTAITPLGMDQGPESAALQDPKEVDRDYIVKASDLKDAGLWPPDSGDFVDDANDETDVVSRYQVKSVPAQSPWRWLGGSYQVLARVHTKFLQEIANFWLDAFTGTDGTSLDSHAADEGDGGYAGGLGTISIVANRIVAATPLAYRYFAPGELNTATNALVRFNLLADDLDGETAEMGLAVRCGASGSGQREGVYCTLRIGYVDGVQKPQLRMVRRRNGANTTVQVLPITPDLSLTETYRLSVTNTDDRILMSLTDASGAVSIAEVANESTLLNDNTGQAVYFAHSFTTTSPWIDELRVDAA